MDRREYPKPDIPHRTSLQRFPFVEWLLDVEPPLSPYPGGEGLPGPATIGLLLVGGCLYAAIWNQSLLPGLPIVTAAYFSLLYLFFRITESKLPRWLARLHPAMRRLERTTQKLDRGEIPPEVLRELDTIKREAARQGVPTGPTVRCTGCRRATEKAVVEITADARVLCPTCVERQQSAEPGVLSLTESNDGGVSLADSSALVLGDDNAPSRNHQTRASRPH